jgi:hypothetical protein
MGAVNHMLYPQQVLLLQSIVQLQAPRPILAKIRRSSVPFLDDLVRIRNDLESPLSVLWRLPYVHPVSVCSTIYNLDELRRDPVDLVLKDMERNSVLLLEGILPWTDAGPLPIFLSL